MPISVSAASRIAGFLCMVFSSSMLMPILVSVWYRDGQSRYLAICLIVQFTLGMLLWLPFRKQQKELCRREGFFIVVMFWVLLSLLGASTFEYGLHLSYMDALFEAVSGLTTTGATVLTGLEKLPPSLLFYRQELQWFGGMGLIVLAVAIMPMLGIGGMALYRAEAPGPMKEEKLTPRLSSSAKALWMIYVGLTATCALAFWLAGMSPFDALSHSLTTVSTGGFSTHDASLGYFDNVMIEDIAMFFMLLGGINFSTHYLVLRNRSLRQYLANSEARNFLIFILGTVVLVVLTLYQVNDNDSLGHTIRMSVFEVVSVITSTGFGIEDFSTWPLFLPVLMIFISFIGGCGGSTAGGIKVMRVMGLVKLGYREGRRLMHPKGVFQIRLGGRIIPQDTLHAIWGFFALYVVTFVILLLLMLATGQDQISGFSAVATCMNNLGPGLGSVAQTFNGMNEAGKLVAVIAMLLGRLEIFTVLVLLHPAYWRN